MESVQQEIYTYLTENDCSIEDAYFVMNDEYNKDRKQIQNLQQLVDTLKQEKKELRAQIELGKTQGTDTTVPQARLQQSSKNLRDAKQTIQQLREHADEIVRSGIQKHAEKSKLNNHKMAHANAEQNQALKVPGNAKSVPAMPSIDEAIHQMNTGISAIAMQMQRCDSNAIHELSAIRDRIDKILQVATPVNNILF